MRRAKADQSAPAEAFPEIDTLDVGRLVLNCVLSDPYVDGALVGMREPRFVELNSAILGDVALRIIELSTRKEQRW